MSNSKPKAKRGRYVVSGYFRGVPNVGSSMRAARMALKEMTENGYKNVAIFKLVRVARGKSHGKH